MPLSPNQMDRLTSGYQAPEVLKDEIVKLIAEMRQNFLQVLTLSNNLSLPPEKRAKLTELDYKLGMSYDIFD